MTLIAAMKFNDKEGAILADEQASKTQRKYDSSVKLHTLVQQPGLNVVAGGTGTSTYLNEVIRLAKQQLAAKPGENFTAEMVSQTVAEMMKLRNKQLREGYLDANFGITNEQLLMQKVDPSVSQQLINYMNGFNSAFLVLGQTNGLVDLYFVDSHAETPFLPPNMIFALGSGSDAAEIVLTQYVTSLHPEDRTDIPKLEGVAKLIEAGMTASKMNLGVGGNLYLKIVGADGITYEPSVDQVKLASDVVKGTISGILTPRYRDHCLDRLLFQDANFTQIDEEMQKQVDNPAAFNRMLRGYATRIERE